jgi:hypothetical protein
VFLFGLIPIACPLTVMGAGLISLPVYGTVEGGVRASSPHAQASANEFVRAQFFLGKRRVFTFSVIADNSAMEEAWRSHLRVIGVCDSFRAAILF